MKTREYNERRNENYHPDSLTRVKTLGFLPIQFRGTNMSTTVIRSKSMRPIPQETTALCWLAAYQMMFQWNGKPLDTIRDLVRGALGDDGADKAYDSGLDRADWPKVAQAFGMTGIAGGDVSIDDISDYLSSGPLLVHGQFPL